MDGITLFPLSLACLLFDGDLPVAFFAGPKMFSSAVHLCIDICSCQSHENGCRLLRFLTGTLV